MMLYHLKSSSCQSLASTITQIVIIGLKYIQNSVNLPYSSVCAEITIVSAHLLQRRLEF